MCGERETTNYKWAQLGSNQRPKSYELSALTAELWALAERIIPCLTQVVKGGNTVRLRARIQHRRKQR